MRPKAGELYKHFKGHLYRVLFICRHSETEEELVVYRSAQSDDGDYWARPLSMWNEEVEVAGHLEPRFLKM